MYRKGISALIINNQNQILLVNLTSFEDHFYSIPGGGLEEGEELVEAVYREVKEELGIMRELLELVNQAKEPIRFDFKNGPRVMNGVQYIGQERYFFLLKFKGNNGDLKLAKNEVRKYIWSNYNDLNKYLLFEGQLESTQKILQELSPK